MISRQTKLQLLVFGLISILGLSYTGVRYAGLGRFFQDQGYVVSADFVDSGGIFKGAEVTNRGVPQGKVVSLTLRQDGVRVGMRMRPGTKIPSDVKAFVGNRSAVGEQYVDLQPQKNGGPYLGGGDVISRDRTGIPIPPTQLLVNLDKLVNSVDTRDVTVVLDELGKAFEGSGNSLQRLVDAGDALTEAATAHLPQTKRLINDGRTVLNTQRDTASQFQSFNRDLADLTGQLRASDPDFRRLFANGTQSANETTDLLESNRSALPILLANLVTVAQVQSIRLPAIKQILVTYPNVIAGGFTVVPNDGTTHFGLSTTGNPPPCTAGYTTTKRRSPSDTTLRTPNLNAYCAVPSSSGQDVRGAQNAPRPAGERPYPNNTGSAVPPRAGAGTAPAASRQSSTGAGAGQDTVLLGDYDPATGNVITADGQRLTIGSSAGASQLFGGSSWQVLLLGPLAP
ncbi:MAG: phospholipid/cholesterol/gamma-HCH transport system substrate-binding protein [Actinomycetota bacterium]|nr:phospholipid/cholesterol/gamma-HCH transport system substrate-binding protein [Actinomycetota bacterium]